MRTTTHWLSNLFIATCATTRFVLSPLVATTTASASSIPAARSTSTSIPWPSTKPPGQSSPKRASASSFSSTAVTSYPSERSCFAIVEPTRPQPITITFMLSGYPLPRLLHDAPVELDATALPHVFDDVPVDRADVGPAEVREAAADRQVDGPVDLLVEERVLHVTRDPRIAADAELPEPTRSLVDVERLQQELLVRLRRGLHDAAGLEHEADPRQLAP